MMWWGGYHWWWPGLGLMAAFMAVCVVVMVVMMGRGRLSQGMGGMCGPWWRRSNRPGTGTSERILDDRLARGEIDITDYRRIRETLAEVSGSAGGDEHVGDRH
jgi:uncharacterized membrane protein